MKRYISSAYKYSSDGKIQYTSLDDLRRLLEEQGFRRGSFYYTQGQVPEKIEIPLQFVAGPATFVLENGYYYKIIYNNDILLKGALPVLFRDYAKDYIIYNKICVASPSRILKATDPEAAQKKLNENRLKDIKRMSISQMLEYINGVRAISDDIAEDAMRQFLYQIPDDDLVTLTNGHWRMEVIDSKAENWASLSMQAYGWHHTTTVQLETSKNTYTTDVKTTEGWHTE